MDDVHGQPLLRAGLGQVEARRLTVVVDEPDTERERTLAGARWCVRHLLAPLQPAGPRQVRDEVQHGAVIVHEHEIEELAVPGRIDEPPPSSSRTAGSKVFSALIAASSTRDTRSPTAVARRKAASDSTSGSSGTRRACHGPGPHGR